MQDWIYGHICQGLPLQEWTYRHDVARVDNEGVEILAPCGRGISVSVHAFFYFYMQA